MVLRRSSRDGYTTAIIGSLIGAVSLLNLGGYLGVLYVKNFMPNAELDGLLPPLYGQFIGWWIGEVLGCWLALRWQNYRRAKKTAIHLAMLTPFGILTWLFFYIYIMSSLGGRFPDLQMVQVQIYFRPISTILVIIAVAWLARFNTKPIATRGT